MYVCISVSMCPGFRVAALVCRIQASAVHVEVTKISPMILSAFMSQTIISKLKHELSTELGTISKNQAPDLQTSNLTTPTALI